MEEARQGPTRFVFRLAGVIVLATLAFGVGQFWTTYQNMRNEQQRSAEKKALFEANKAKLTERFSHISGMSTHDLSNGFWSTWRDADGNEHVLYININDLASLNLTDAQISELLSHVTPSSVISSLSGRVVPEEDLPAPLQFHNKLYSFANDGSFLKTKQSLVSIVASGTPTSEDLFELSYMSELSGDYATRDALDARNCALFKVRCKSDMNHITITGRVVDMNGHPVQGARVSLMSRPEVKPVETTVEGIYTLSASINEMEKIRVAVSKRNYSEGVVSTVSVSKNKHLYRTDDIVVTSPINIVTIDTDKKTISDPSGSIDANGTITIKTEYSTYKIPAGAIVHKDGRPYVGVVDVYLYEFTKNTVPPGLMQIDTFDQVMGYAGDLMKSFGMPYIQFFAPSGEELHVLRSNPMVLTYRIANMKELREDTAKLYGPLTDADMKLLTDASVGQPYAIDRDFLIRNQMLRFPAFWVFDRTAGIWENIGVSVLDLQGTIRTIFYTINNT